MNFMDKKHVSLKFLECTNSEIDVLCADEVHNIIPIADKNGKAHLIVEYYDDERCINSSFICDGIKFITE